MPNLIASPRFWKNKALLLKAEATVGTDAVPTGLANWIEARNLQLTPMQAETAERNIDVPYMGNTGKLQVGQYVTCSFEVALAGPGAAGDAPKIAPALLACAMQETLTASTSAAYTLVSTAIGACSIYINVDGTRHKMIGSRGTVGVALNARGIPVLRFQFEAIYLPATADALPAIDRGGWPVEEPVNSAKTTQVTIGGTALAFSALEISLNNQLSRLDLPGPQTEVAIGDRNPSGTVTVLAPGLGVFDPFAIAEAGTNVALTTTHGSAAGKRVQIDANTIITEVAYAQIERMAAYTLTLEPNPVAGNDEFALTFL